REYGAAPSDVTEADDADGASLHVVADEAVAVDGVAAADRAVGFGNPLREREHHADGVLGDRLAIAACLVEHQHAGGGAGLHVDRVVAGPVGRDDQQIRDAREEIGGGGGMRGVFVARGADLVGGGG